MSECEDDWAYAPCLRPTGPNVDPLDFWFASDQCRRCGWPLDAHEPFYVRWWRRLTTLGTHGHGSA